MNAAALTDQAATTAEWACLGHPACACSGHTDPLPDCPAPSVHALVFWEKPSGDEAA